MCDERMAVVGRAAGRRAQRQHDAKVAADAIRSYQNGASQPTAFDRATGKAKTVLAWVGGICAAAAVGSGVLGVALHVLAVMLGMAAGLAVLGGAALITRRVRQLTRQPLPYPVPLHQLTPDVQAAIAAGMVERPAAIPAPRARVRG